MSGFYSMNSVLKNNRNLLRQKKPYLDSFKKYLKNRNGTLENKKYSKEELVLLKKKYQKERKREQVKTITITILILIPILIFVFFIVNNLYEYNNTKLYKEYSIEQEKENSIVQKKIKNKLKKYNYHITEGDKWIEKKHWKNAIFLYKIALEISPKKFEANYRLALAYSYNCTYKKLDCDKGKKLNNKLLKYFPENTQLQKLKIIFDK